MSSPTAPSVASPPNAGARLLSLDALRGFDMLWIIGAGAAVRAPGKDSDSPFLRLLAGQLEHKDWAGFAFYDLIFPLFVFIVGVSLVWSLTRTVAEHGRAQALRRIARRSALLFVLGIFYSGGLNAAWPEIRLLGVLQRIALAYAGAGLLFCFFKPRALAGICGGILVGYWALMSFVPIRDLRLDKDNVAKLAATATGSADARQLFLSTTNRVSGRFEPGYNLAHHVDFNFCPAKIRHLLGPRGPPQHAARRRDVPARRLRRPASAQHKLLRQMETHLPRLLRRRGRAAGLCVGSAISGG